MLTALCEKKNQEFMQLKMQRSNSNTQNGVTRSSSTSFYIKLNTLCILLAVKIYMENWISAQTRNPYNLCQYDVRKI